MDLVSIIIPVYKTEKYLEECMDSVLKQTWPALEIILVDDGSPDNAPAMCDKYTMQYPNVKVIHQKNSGLGLSRNAGLSKAEGAYILFLDSDDCLDGPETVSRLVLCAREKHADIVTGGFRRFHNTEISAVNVLHLREGEYTKTTDFRFKGFFMYGHLAYNWGKLYRKEFLDKYDLKCRAYPFTQDKAHNMACYAYEPVYAFLDDSVYLYRVNEESVTYKYKENLMPVWIEIATDFRDFLKERGIQKRYWDFMAFHIFFGSFFLAKQELQFKRHGIMEAARILKKYGKNPFVKRAMLSLAKGKYVREIQPLSWKIVMRMASVLFSIHAYWLFAAGIAVLRKLQIDSRITKSRYKGENSR
ncbi:MAG: glycosyltransferase family 2 protein [Lachnospiraceae bacterium]|nr:glycosyltransferase family 2 protein [Lachnospiraceae bacterium]